MECHKCQYDGKANKICLKCPGPSQANNFQERSNHGRNIVSLDSYDETRDKAEAGMIAPVAPEPEPTLEHLTPDNAARVRRFLGWFLDLSSMNRDIIAMHLLDPGKAKHKIALELGTSDQRVGQTIQKYAGKWGVRQAVR